MSSGGGGSYDASKDQAEVEKHRLELQEELTPVIQDAQEAALFAAGKSMETLNEGFGLLTNYLDTEVKNAYQTGGLYDWMLKDQLPEIRQKAAMGAKHLTDTTLSSLSHVRNAKVPKYKNKIVTGSLEYPVSPELETQGVPSFMNQIGRMI